MTALKVAAIQAVSLAENWQAKWDGADVPHALALLRSAAEQGAKLACLPELYPLVGEAELCREAKALGLYVIAGLAEGSQGSWHNTSSLISPKGQVIGRQTKNYPTAGEEDNGVVPGARFQVFDTPLGRLGIVICADFAFFDDGVKACKKAGADILFNPAVWFALSEVYPATVIGRHMEYSIPIVGVNLGRNDVTQRDSPFPPAGGFSTVCIPPPITDMDQLWDWFCNKPGGIDSGEGFIQTMGRGEEMLVVEIDIEAVRRFPGYFSTRNPVTT
ncbi:MAG: carbon-nitrogen hydrolase family protein [Kiloniellales bacterium]